MKKTLAAFLAVLLLVSFLPVFAEDTVPPGRVELVVSEEDADGYFTLSVNLYEMELIGMQLHLNFDSSILRPASYADGLLTNNLNDYMRSDVHARSLDGALISTDLFSFIFTEANIETNRLTLACYTNLGQPIPNSLVSERRVITVPAEGLTVCQFRFKRINKGKIEFQLANVNADHYDPLLPEGIYIDNGTTTTPFILKYVTPKDDTIWSEITQAKPVITPSPSSGNNGNSSSGNSNKTQRDRRKENTIILQIGNYATSVNGYLSWIDDNNKSVVPFITQDRTMVPLRFISETLGATVHWQEETQEVTIEKDTYQIRMTIDKAEYWENSDLVTMETAPVIIDDRTFVPLRFVSESLRQDVCWIENSQVVIISPKDYPWNMDNQIEQELLNDSLLIMSPLLRDMK